MSEDLRNIIAEADVIVDGYAFVKNGDLAQVVSLQNPDDSLVIGAKDKIIETTMDDIEMQIVSELFQKNKQFLGV